MYNDDEWNSIRSDFSEEMFGIFKKNIKMKKDGRIGNLCILEMGLNPKKSAVDIIKRKLVPLDDHTYIIRCPYYKDKENIVKNKLFPNL